MFNVHPYGKRAAKAHTAEWRFHHGAHLRAAKRAAEIAILVAGLMFCGFLATHPAPGPVWIPGAKPCVHFGRAGGHCAPAPEENSARRDAEPKCVLLGRAGRFCSP